MKQRLTKLLAEEEEDAQALRGSVSQNSSTYVCSGGQGGNAFAVASVMWVANCPYVERDGFTIDREAARRDHNPNERGANLSSVQR